MNAHTGTVVGHSFWFNNWGCTVDRYPLQLRANLTVTERIPSKCKTPAPANYTVRALTRIVSVQSSYLSAHSVCPVCPVLPRTADDDRSYGRNTHTRRLTVKRHGGDKRGNSQSRKMRKLWMLATWGDGQTCPCVHCHNAVSFPTVEADRIVPGGPYRRDNVQPSCRACNLARSNNTHWSLAA